VLGFVSALPVGRGGKMAKTTMKAQEVRVEGAISGTTGSSKRPFQRWSAFWPAVPLYPYGRRRTPPRSGEGHGLDLRPATGHFIHRRAASHDRREARRSKIFVYAPVVRLQSVSTLSRS